MRCFCIGRGRASDICALVVCALALALALCTARWVGKKDTPPMASAGTAPGDSSASLLASTGLKETPLRLTGISYGGPFPVVLDESFWKGVVQIPVARLDASLLMHLQSLLGPAATVTLAGDALKDDKEVAISTLLLSGRLSHRYFGNALLIRSAQGIRARDPGLQRKIRGAEAHRDQLLSHLGGIGLPISTEIECVGYQGTIAEMICDSMDHFDIQQKELEWTTLAYLHYMTHIDTWRDRFGARHSFDDIAQELLSRPLVGASCNGIHILIALSAIVQVDNNRSILSPETRGRVLDRLGRSMAVAIDMQREDGCWDPLCIYRFPGSRRAGSTALEPVIEDSKSVRQSITSHLVLWINALPPEITCPAGVQEGAAAWLSESIVGLSPDKFWDDYCTNTHVLNAICKSGKDAKLPSLPMALTER